MGNTYDITDGLTAGIYTISAKIVDTNGWYIDSPAATKKVTVTSNILPKLALNKEEGDYRIGDVVNVTITAPGHNAVEVEYYDETIKAYNSKTIALTNGSAIYTSAPLADGIWRDFTVKKADDMSITNVSVEYGASLPEPVITLDKEDYLVGDTARITLTGESAEHFTVRLYCYYDDTDESRTLLNEINYAAVNGQVVIDLPFTERGHFSVDVTSYNETYQVYSYNSAYEYVNVYAPEDAPIDLAEPAGIKILPASKGLTISWNAVPGAQTYSVYRSVGGKKFERVVDKLTVTSFTDTTVPANKVVLYKIRASASNGSGSYYNESDIKSYMLLAQAKKVCYAVMKRPSCETLIHWARRANNIFAGFIIGKIVDSLIIGVICYICMLIFGIEYPLLISVIVGVTNVIPFFGPYIGAVPSILFLLLVNPVSALWFGIFIVILQQIDGNVIGPLILGDHVGLSAFWIMLSITVGGGLFGFAGMVLSVPTFALIYAIVRTVIDRRLKNRGLPEETERYIDAPNTLTEEKNTGK